jgi:hypothetical protein
MVAERNTGGDMAPRRDPANLATAATRSESPGPAPFTVIAGPRLSARFRGRLRGWGGPDLREQGGSLVEIGAGSSDTNVIPACDQRASGKYLVSMN